MDEQQAAERFLDSGFAFVSKGQSSLRIRVSRLTESEATELKQQYGGGHVSFWEPSGTWQWESQGRSAISFMQAIRPWVELKPVRRLDEAKA